MDTSLESYLRLFVAKVPVAMAMFDRDMRYLAASERWLTAYGINDREAIGRSHYEIFPAIQEHWRTVNQKVHS